MKKFTAIILLLITIFLFGCDGTSLTTQSSNQELFDAIQNLKTAESVTMETSTASDVSQDFVVITKIQGIYSHTTFEGLPSLNQYNLEFEGKYYLLQKPGNVYYPSEVVVDEIENPLDMILNGEGYEISEFILDDDYYVYQSENENDSFSIKVVNGYIQEMIFSFEESEIEFHVTITFRDYNTTTVTLPTNTVNIETYFNLVNELSEYELRIGDGGITFIKNNDTVQCVSTFDSCDYEGPPFFNYIIEEELFNLEDTSVTMDQLYEQYPDLAIPRSDFENMIALYSMIFN